MGEKEIQPLLEQYINDTLNPETNFWLAWEYDKIGQNAAALSYYLRCAELSKNEDLVYESLLCSWNCMGRVGGRPAFERGQILQAISHSPHRPEGYNAICLWLEFCGNIRIPSNEEKYLMMYSYACIGLSNILSNKSFKYYDRYDGYFAFIYHKALSAWYIGKKQESEELFLELYNNPKNDLDERYKSKIKENLINLNLLPKVEKIGE